MFLVFAFVNIDGRIPGGSLAIRVCWRQDGFLDQAGFAMARKANEKKTAGKARTLI